eukprot:CAMPEP_0174254762 /NCGR_PEP_ID=MMETSP0439-20130205/4100_1 /TAXON_ID=0 /ORGANISM="Stereomyxa ramosa, Strain Chinc5" /LENGTH=95 /DNA_ID=CAMNT_0015336563 /DNA_START=16 /DNA_END=303 /DNA_ORIENTATION=-
MDAADKEEFRDYLERSGVIDTLTKALAGLYEEKEKPASPLDFVKQHLLLGEESNLAALEKENKSLKAENISLKQQLDELSKKNEQLLATVNKLKK